MRLVGLLMILLGGAVTWWALHGESPVKHAQQLIDLFGHQHAPGQPAAGSTGTSSLLQP